MTLALTLPQILGLSLVGAIIILFIAGMIGVVAMTSSSTEDHPAFLLEQLDAEIAAFKDWGFDDIEFEWRNRAKN